MRNLNSDLDYLRNFRCKHGQLAGFGVMSTWLLPMIGNLRCWNNIHYGNNGLFPYSMDVCWTNDIVPSKIKSNLNSHCQLTCDDWGTPNTKLKYCQCASTALLCYQSKQTFYCVQRITTYNWRIWIVIFSLHCYQTSLSTWWLFLCIWDFGYSRNQKGAGSNGIRGEVDVGPVIPWLFLCFSKWYPVKSCIWAKFIL